MSEVNGRVATLPCGRRLAGLGGVFKGKVWFPKGPEAHEVKFKNAAAHTRARAGSA